MLQRKIYRDTRGYNSSLFRANEDIMGLVFVEDRISKSYFNTIRGFHGDNKTYKLCTCLQGMFKLVVYDLLTSRREEIVLTEEKGNQYLIRPYTLNAHQCLTDECLLHYKWTEFYDLEGQWSVNYNDPTINPQWEFSHLGTQMVSERDILAPFLKDFKYE